jgi:hypothetical protein
MSLVVSHTLQPLSTFFFSLQYCDLCFFHPLVKVLECLAYTSGTVYGQCSVQTIFLYLKPYVMAEIHVQPKKHSSSLWLWILLVLIVVAVVYFLTRNNNRVERANDGMNSTSFVQPSYNGVQLQSA